MIWPPAGLALVGVLIGGPRVWPGIWLGSFLLNIWTSFEATSAAALLISVAVPTGIGAGAVMQALAGGSLVRHFVGFPTPLDQGREVVGFLLLTGPIGCLVSASFGVMTLAVSGQIPWAMFVIHWGTWWVGDTLGVLIVTPLALSFLAEPREIWRRRRVSVAVPLAGALALAFVVFIYTNAQERERLRLIFERQATALAQNLRNGLENYLIVLYTLEGFYTASHEVSRQAFHAFVQPSLARHPGLRALSWNRLVADAQREAYELAVRQEGFPDFQITEQDAEGRIVRAARRPEYVAVTYIEPLEEHKQVLGFDVASLEDRLKALQQARDSGQPVATGRLTLVQEAGGQVGLLVFLPIYGHGLPGATVEERLQSLQGYVAGMLRLGDIVEAALQGQEWKGMALRIEDESAPAGQQLLYDSHGWVVGGMGPAFAEKPGGELARLGWETTAELAGRRWMLRFAPTFAYVAARLSLQPWAMLAAGLLFTSLLGLFLLLITGRAIAVEHLMAERTAQLEASKRAEERFRVAVEAAPNAMVMVNGEGHIVLVNSQTERLFAYSREELIGQSVELLVPERFRLQHPAHRADFSAAPQARPMGAGRDLYGRRKDGSEFPIEIGLNPIETG
jgi:PAS domain S-box-containing protein